MHNKNGGRGMGIYEQYLTEFPKTRSFRPVIVIRIAADKVCKNNLRIVQDSSLIKT